LVNSLGGELMTIHRLVKGGDMGEVLNCEGWYLSLLVNIEHSGDLNAFISYRPSIDRICRMQRKYSHLTLDWNNCKEFVENCIQTAKRIPAIGARVHSKTFIDVLSQS
jgi:hypothetical protein